jgi:hypothetical protein
VLRLGTTIPVPLREGRKRLTCLRSEFSRDSTMPRIATIDERYQSYNVEMAEVTGGSIGSRIPNTAVRRRKRHRRPQAPAFPPVWTPKVFEYWPPIDLSKES